MPTGSVGMGETLAAGDCVMLTLSEALRVTLALAVGLRDDDGDAVSLLLTEAAALAETDAELDQPNVVLGDELGVSEGLGMHAVSTAAPLPPSPLATAPT